MLPAFLCVYFNNFAVGEVMFQTYIRDLKREFEGYGASGFARDIMAGFTVAAVALPLALAFGVSSGATAAAGLITAIIAGIVISALSGGYYQISGPTGAMAAILVGLVAKSGVQGVFIATLLAGILLVLSGFLHLGRLTAFVPAPVITGFTSGIAVIIALGQIDNFFGTTSVGDSAVSKLLSYGRLGFHPDLRAAAIGLLVIGIMLVFPKKWNAVIPGSLVGIVCATAAAIILNLDVASVGEIPKSLLLKERLAPGELNIPGILMQLGPACSIALLNMLESLLCGASAGRATGVKLNNDRELIAQGIGNIVLPFFGGIPATAALARTSVAVKSNARTRLTGIFHALALLIMMFILSPVISRVPLAALAGVLMVTAWRMNEWEAIRYIFSHQFKGAMIKFFATMLATILFDLTVAILVGVSLGLIFMVARLSKIEINYEKVDPSRLRTTDSNFTAAYKNALVCYLTGPILFANTDAIEEILLHCDGCDHLFLSMRGVSYIDISGAQGLLDVVRALQEKKIRIAICGLPQSAMTMVARSGITDIIGEENFYWSVEHALLDIYGMRPEDNADCRTGDISAAPEHEG